MPKQANIALEIAKIFSIFVTIQENKYDIPKSHTNIVFAREIIDFLTENQQLDLNVIQVYIKKIKEHADSFRQSRSVSLPPIMPFFNIRISIPPQPNSFDRLVDQILRCTSWKEIDAEKYLDNKIWEFNEQKKERQLKNHYPIKNILLNHSAFAVPQSRDSKDEVTVDPSCKASKFF